MSRQLPLKGFAVGIVVTILIAVASIGIAAATESPVNLGPLGSAGYMSSGDVVFALDLRLGWLALAMPLIGAVIGFGVERLIRRTPSGPAAT